MVGKNLARVRAARGISQTELADRIDPAKLHIAQSYISKLERGQKNATVLTLAVLAEALQVRLSEFFVEEE